MSMSMSMSALRVGVPGGLFPGADLIHLSCFPASNTTSGGTIYLWTRISLLPAAPTIKPSKTVSWGRARAVRRSLGNYPLPTATATRRETSSSMHGRALQTREVNLLLSAARDFVVAHRFRFGVNRFRFAVITHVLRKRLLANPFISTLVAC